MTKTTFSKAERDETTASDMKPGDIATITSGSRKGKVVIMTGGKDRLVILEDGDYWDEIGFGKIKVRIHKAVKISLD
jgi:hypothetical protein